MSEVDVPSSKRLKTCNQINSNKQDLDIDLKSPKKEILAPEVSEMIHQAIANNTIPLAKLPPWLDLSE